MTELARQFDPEQLTLFGGPAEPRSVPQEPEPAPEAPKQYRVEPSPGGYQLPMFMTAREIYGQFAPVDQVSVYKGGNSILPTSYRMEGEDEMWVRKSREARGDTVYSKNFEFDDPTKPVLSLTESIKQEGVKNPVQLQYPDYAENGERPKIHGGHHRIAASLDVAPDRLMPVLFHRNIVEAMYDPHHPYEGLHESDEESRANLFKTPQVRYSNVVDMDRWRREPGDLV